jgi:hypothetical protein
MSSAVTVPHVDGLPEGEYRALSSAAVVSVLAGVASLTTMLDWVLGLVPAIGILMGLRALWQIRRSPEELTGSKVAAAGIALCALFWAAGWGWLAYDYYTEVPPGHQRISYAELQADAATGAAIPDSAKQLDGKQIFIKGYVYPGPQKSGINHFILVRDNGTCCFGGPAPKLNDMIEVKLSEPLSIEYSARVFKLAGTFHVNTSDLDSVGKVLYQLDAHHVR